MYVLIVILSVSNVVAAQNVNVTMQDFNTQYACEQAKDYIRKELTRTSSVSHNDSLACVIKGDHPR